MMIKLLKNVIIRDIWESEFAFHWIVLQEHRTSKPVQLEEKSPIQQRRKNRNRYELTFILMFDNQNFSLKDFICHSSSSSAGEEEDPLEFYPKVNRLIDKDSSWRK